MNIYEVGDKVKCTCGCHQHYTVVSGDKERGIVVPPGKGQGYEESIPNNGLIPIE